MIQRHFTHHHLLLQGLPKGDILARRLPEQFLLWRSKRNTSSHRGPVTALTCSRDGKYVASGGQDSAVKCWNARTGDLIATCRQHTGPITALAWSPDGRFLASGSRDTTIQIWDAHAGHLLYTYRLHSGSILTLAWSPDGTQIASSASGEGGMHLWEPDI